MRWWCCGGGLVQHISEFRLVWGSRLIKFLLQPQCSVLCGPSLCVCGFLVQANEACPVMGALCRNGEKPSCFVPFTQSVIIISDSQMRGCDSKWSVMLTRTYLYFLTQQLMAFLADTFLNSTVDILVLSPSEESLLNHFLNIFQLLSNQYPSQFKKI